MFSPRIDPTKTPSEGSETLEVPVMPGPMRNPAKPRSRANEGTSTRRGSGLIDLPADGCDLPVPRLPKGREWSSEERKQWRTLWESPQATQWDDSYLAAVAAYVCHSSAVYSGKAAAWQAQEMRHLGAQLGLTPAGMQQLGWRIADA